MNIRKNFIYQQTAAKVNYTTDTVVTVSHLLFQYSSKTKILFNDLNLTVKRGDYLSIVGENGTGKSTFIKLLLGLLKPLSGYITCSCKNIGYVPQKKTSLSSFPITVFELLNSYRILQKCADKTIIDHCLADVNLLSHKHALVGTLSGGQVQKMYIARALIGKPDLLILDEPSTGVDIQGQHDMYAFIKNLNTEKKLTVISVEHNLDAAVLNSTDIFHLANGCGHLCTPEKYAAEFLRFRRQ
ncbi:MAG: metal ABC transporter ATP-binding protein [Treponema sp.]